MRLNYLRLFLALCVFFGQTAAMASQTKTPRIPLEILFGNPEKTSPQISPDGTKISYLAPLDGVLNIWVRTLQGGDDKPVTQDKGRGIRSYFWAQDGRHLMYVQDREGDENWHLYSLDLGTREIKNYTPFDGVQTRIVGVDKHYPNEILISLNKEDKKLHDVYRLDLSTSKLELSAKNPGDISGWIVDTHFKVRGAVRTRPDGGNDLLIREDETAPWKKLTGWDLDDGMENGPIGFTKDGNSMYLRDSSDSDKSRLKKIQIQTQKTEVIFADPDYDFGGLMSDPETYEPQLAVIQKERIHYVILDPAIQPDIDVISNISEGDLSIISRDNADQIWLLAFSQDKSAASYYSYDRNTKKAVFLFKNRTALDPYTLASMEPIQFTSKDGLTIHGYITFPPGKERSDLPMVLNVHGGPWSREGWGYNAQAQWLANRGYICLQVNFRGSTGYGKNFVNIADKEWGGAMQQDLTDAVHWAIEKGYADPKRAAIYGGSYGGYAALAGATFTPDLFRCAVDIVGPSNLLTFLNTIPPYWNLYRLEFYKRVGDPATEEEFLKSRSPFFHADRIKIPLLIAQGANDPRVNQQESEQIVAQLKKKGIPHEYLLFPDEGHGFARPENRLKFYAACEKFLAKHLGGE